MSGKFMKVRRIVIPTLTMAIIASQLLGCAAVSQSELLTMINKGDAIEIEVAVPLNQEEGTEKSVDWTQLDQLTTHPDLRKAMEDTFKIVPYGENSKNGVFYVNIEGKQDGNNTLYNVFANNYFRSNYWNNVEAQADIAVAAAENYADIEFVENDYSRAMLAAMNGYFNILNDSEPGYANMDSTISRLEAMSGLFKAENPVTDTLSEDVEFRDAVDPSNSNEYTIYASNLSEQSYLDVSSGSLDKLTANGTITRGELVYMLVQKYFATEYENADVSATCYSDVKNGGDIATAQKFIENNTPKEHWQSYELTYALQNPDKGMPERMYKAMVVAYEKGIITDKESAWDEGVTKEAFLEMLTNTYLALEPQFSAERGITDENNTDEDLNKILENIEQSTKPAPGEPITLENCVKTTGEHGQTVYGTPEQPLTSYPDHSKLQPGDQYYVYARGRAILNTYMPQGFEVDVNWDY